MIARKGVDESCSKRAALGEHLALLYKPVTDEIHSLHAVIQYIDRSTDAKN